MLGFFKSVRNATLIGIGHTVAIGAISKILLPIASWSAYIPYLLLKGTFNANWVLGAGVTFGATMIAWVVAEETLTKLNREKIKDIMQTIKDDDLIYLATGFGVPLAIALVNPLAGVIAGLIIGPLALPHTPGFAGNVISEGSEPIVASLVKKYLPIFTGKMNEILYYLDDLRRSCSKQLTYGEYGTLLNDQNRSLDLFSNGESVRLDPVGSVPESRARQLRPRLPGQDDNMLNDHRTLGQLIDPTALERLIENGRPRR